MKLVDLDGRLGWCLLFAVFVGFQPSLALGEEKSLAKTAGGPLTDAESTFFESKIRPILVKHCYDCHSAEAGLAEGGLRVDSRDALLRGGNRGPAVVPGDADKSLLIIAVTHADADLKMPPKQPRLSASVLTDLKTWIKNGAPDPRRDDTRAVPVWDKASAKDHWAYQLLPVTDDGKFKQPTIPIFENEVDREWPRRDLDRFILAELKSHELAPSPDASHETLLRRLHFDLVGLPPTPDDLRWFELRIVESGLDAAIKDETDRLLEQPQFGERWGRHWLDVARFGESSGKEANISFPYAWRYRDYVIDAFNRDLPYDQFLTEQIAGDLLPFNNDAERARLLIATGYLALGPKNLDEMNQFQFLADVIDEQIDSVTRGVLANSVACARCHDHKFDPFSMHDYYALAGVFASSETFFGTSVSPANRVGGKPLPLPIDAGYEPLHSSIPAAKVAELQAELDEMNQEEESKRAAVQRAIADGKDPSGIFTLTDALRIFWRRGAIHGQLHKVSDDGEALPLAMGVLDREQSFDVPLLERGEIGRPGETVPRAFPDAISPTAEISIPSDQSGRLEFANWLTHPQHPLTSRVIVNRIWKHLFGAGLVSSVDNFGTTGASPSHPELLDHLAMQFVENGWSIKQLVREMVLSRTYRQSSDDNEAAFLQDPDNRWLWRASKRRLEAEAIRDAMLVVSGELDESRPVGSLVGRVIMDKPISLIGLDKRLPTDLDGSLHRSVYLPVIRDRLPDVLDLFDFAEPSQVTGDRETTNVPTQALFLMNSPFVQDRAVAFADRLKSQADNSKQRVRLAFQWCYNREPDQDEEQRSLEFLQQNSKQSNETDRWISFCQALLCTAEFRNLD